MNWSLTITMIVTLALRVDFIVSMTCSPFPYDQIQPDGSVVTLKMNGDEFGHEASDLKGYTVVLGNDRFIYYAAEESETGHLIATEFIVGKVDPESKGLKKGAKDKSKKNCKKFLCKGSKGKARGLRGETEDRRLATPTIGTLNNLVIPIRFKDHKSRPLPTRRDIDILMNHEGPHSLAPTGSVRDVFLKNSYGKLTVDSTVVEWVDSSFREKEICNRNNAADGPSGLTSYTWEFLKDALETLDSEGFDFTQFDLDGNNEIDAITFLHSGYAAEFPDTDQYGSPKGDRMWSHKWAMDSPDGYVTWDGVRILDYHISPAVWGVSGNEIGRIGVIAHEIGHFLGVTDLYDTDSSSGKGNGIGSWGLMANSWGFEGDQRYPPHMCAWSKIKMGWLEPVEAQYGLNKISATEIDDPNHPQVIKVSHGYPSNEYLLIENRQPIGFDSVIPQGGLLIYHIDDDADYNTQGYPGQSGWPRNGKHYKVALLQADSNYDLEKDFNRGDSGDVFHGQGKDFINSEGVSGDEHPNTNAYQNGIIITTTNQIFSISNSGTDMTFYFTNEDKPVDTSSPSESTSNHPSTSPEPSSIPSSTQGPSFSQAPSATPSLMPSLTPSTTPPTPSPTESPSSAPTSFPVIVCSIWQIWFNTCPEQPTRRPTSAPIAATPATSLPTKEPSSFPSNTPTRATLNPSATPSSKPSKPPSMAPSHEPSTSPSNSPTHVQSASQSPSAVPSSTLSFQPSASPSIKPSSSPSVSQTNLPSTLPSKRPSFNPSGSPSTSPPTVGPTPAESHNPSSNPSLLPSMSPSNAPTHVPSASPSPSTSPSTLPSFAPSIKPSNSPSAPPSDKPSSLPSVSPSTSPPTIRPTSRPTRAPTPTNCGWWARIRGRC